MGSSSINGFLKGLAALAAQKVVEREIEYEGTAETFHFRKITGDEADDISLALFNDEGKVDPALMKGNVSRQVAKSLCDEHGNPVASAEDIGGLPSGLRAKFQAVFDELNGAPKGKKDHPAEI